MIQIEFTKGKIDAFSCIGEAWDVVRSQYPLFVLINLVVAIVSAIPYVGFFCQGPITCGYFYCVLAKMRGERVRFGMVFKGFSMFFPACIIGILSAIPVRLQRYPGIFAIFGNIFPPLIAIPLGFILLVLVLAWGLGMSFGYALLVDYKVKLGQAVRLSFEAARANAMGLIRFSTVTTVFAFALVLLPAVLPQLADNWLVLLSVPIFLLMLILVSPLLGTAGVVICKQVFPDEIIVTKNNSILNL